MEIDLKNTAGWIKDGGKSFQDLLRSAVTEIIFGSVTVEFRPGTTGQNFYGLEDGTSVNSIGLKNNGIEGYDPILSELVEMAHRAGKLFRLSIAPLSLEDIPLLIAFAERHKVDILELNLGCPNVRDHGTRKPIFAYDLDLTHAAVTLTRNQWQERLAVKLSPYKDMTLLKKIGGAMNDLLAAGDIVVSCNTYPDFAPVDEAGKHLLNAVAPDGTIIHAGGMAGTRLRPYCRENTRQLRGVLNPKIKIEAVGGIECGQDLVDSWTDGAKGGQIGTAYFTIDNARIFSEVAQGAAYSQL